MIMGSLLCIGIVDAAIDTSVCLGLQARAAADARAAAQATAAVLQVKRGGSDNLQGPVDFDRARANRLLNRE